MHQRQTRISSLLLTILLAATTASAAASTNKKTECITSRSSDLTAVAACGHKETLRQCFSNPDDFGWAVNGQAKYLQICFLNAGCTPEAALVEAEWTIRRCDEGTMDLRKRRDPLAPTPTPETYVYAHKYDDVPAATPTPTGYLHAQRRDEPSPPEPTTQPTLLPDFKLFKCYTTAMTTTSICTARSGGGMDCGPAEWPYYKCIEGMSCRPDAAGLPGCVEATTRIETSGMIVAIVFGTIVLIATIAICTCCCRDRNARRRLRKAAELATVQREAQAVALKQRPVVNVRGASSSGDRSSGDVGEPLMDRVAATHPDGGGYTTQQYSGPQHDPFSDHHQQSLYQDRR